MLPILIASVSDYVCYLLCERMLPGGYNFENKKLTYMNSNIFSLTVYAQFFYYLMLIIVLNVKTFGILVYFCDYLTNGEI